MVTKVGENICKLRKSRGFTQQQLSEILGVSIAAISKWETGAAYPDIELLPKIANIFDVSIDYFFDYQLNTLDNRIQLIENAKEVFETGQHLKGISMLSDALLRYPNDCDIKYIRADMMINYATRHIVDLEKKNILIEANKELLEVIKSSKSREVIEESYYLLSMSYINLKDFDKAIAAIKQICQKSTINTGIALMRIYLEGGDIAGAKKQFELNLYLSLASIHANTVWIDKLFKDDLEGAASFYEMAIDTFKAFSGNYSCRFDVYISSFYERVALIYAKANECNKAIHSLKQALEYAQSYDNLKGDNDLPQFDKLNANETGWNKIYNQKARLLNTIEANAHEAYTTIRSRNEFIEIVSALKNSLS